MENQQEERSFDVSNVLQEVKQRMADLMERYLAEECHGRALDNDEDRMAVALKMVDYVTQGREIDTSPEKMIPNAAYHLGFQVWDQTTRELIVKIVLNRTPDMTDGDFLQMQNFFWVTIGRAIRDNPEVLQTLAAGGIMVTTKPDGETGGQQFAS